MIFPISEPVPSKIRSVSPSDFGQKTFEFDDGSTSRLVKYLEPRFTSINVEYNGVEGSLVATLLDFYRNSAKGLKEGFTLPPEFFSRHPSEFFSLIEVVTSNKKWWFTSPPKIETIVVNIYNIKFNLESRGEN